MHPGAPSLNALLHFRLPRFSDPPSPLTTRSPPVSLISRPFPAHKPHRTLPTSTDPQDASRSWTTPARNPPRRPVMTTPRTTTRTTRACPSPRSQRRAGPPRCSPRAPSSIPTTARRLSRGISRGPRSASRRHPRMSRRVMMSSAAADAY